MVTYSKPKFIDISDWQLSEQGQTGAMYGEGALSKFLLKDTLGEQWMFKETWHRIKERHGYEEQLHHQFWSEIIANLLASIMGLHVTETHVGYVPCGKNFEDISFFIGVLSKWFVGKEDNFFRGSEFLQSIASNKNERYTEKDCTFDKIHFKETSIFKQWAIMAIFDIIIGNTDRHHENWGLLRNKEQVKFAPVYDNGVSLGFRQTEESINTSEKRKKVIQNLWRKYRYKYKASDTSHRMARDILLVLTNHTDIEKNTLLLPIGSIRANTLQYIRNSAMLIREQVIKQAQIDLRLNPYILSNNRLKLMIESITYRTEKLKELIHDIYQ